MNRFLLVLSVVILNGCATEQIKANFLVAKSPEQLTKCDYISTFNMNFSADGVSQSLATSSERQKSALDFKKAVAAGANTIYRVEPAPAPLVKVNAYRCKVADLTAPR
jgi:hypothetical protein